MTDQAIPSSKSVAVSIGMAGTVSLEGLDELMEYAITVNFRPDGAAVIFVKGDETRTHVFPIVDMIREASKGINSWFGKPGIKSPPPDAETSVPPRRENTGRSTNDRRVGEPLPPDRTGEEMPPKPDPGPRPHA